jgi:2-oxoglutarate ferredoxin oxidoreductase subunit alpha
VQAESEVAAINMEYGAAAAGIRVMTSSSSPGMALKQEGISYLAGADLPCVIVNISRGGPGLGSILPAQGDYYQATRGGGNGDYHLPVYAPSSVQEATDLTQKAFNVADKYRTPVMILGDGILGQMMEPVILPEPEVATTSYDKAEFQTNGTRGTRVRNVVNSLFLTAEELEAANVTRYEHYAMVKKEAVLYEEMMTEDADVVLVSYGASARVCISAVKACRDAGQKVGLFRPLTLWPFPTDQLYALTDTAKAFISVEMSMGQLIEEVELATRCKRPVGLVGRAGGKIPTVGDIMRKVQEVTANV